MCTWIIPAFAFRSHGRRSPSAPTRRPSFLPSPRTSPNPPNLLGLGSCADPRTEASAALQSPASPACRKPSRAEFPRASPCAAASFACPSPCAEPSCTSPAPPHPAPAPPPAPNPPAPPLRRRPLHPTEPAAPPPSCSVRAAQVPVFDENVNVLEEKPKDPTEEEIKKLASEMRNDLEDLIHRARPSLPYMQIARGKLKKFMHEINQEIPVRQQSRVEEVDAYLGCGIPVQIDILPPTDNLTGGKCKRNRLGENKHKKSKGKVARMCRTCNEIGTHDSRNCLLRKQAK